MILCLDIETCSAASITDGAWAYAEHPSTRVWCVSYALAEGRDDTRIDGTWRPGEPVPFWLVQHVEAGGELLAHNASFEQAVWRYILGPQHGWPTPRVEQWRDTQVSAALANLPIDLDTLAKVFRGAPKKDNDGAALMRRLAKVTEHAGRFVYPTPTDAELARLVDYCEADVAATLWLWWRLPRVPKGELALWHEDQRINQAGVTIDAELVARAAQVANQRRDLLDQDVFGMTRSEVDSSRSTPALKSWLKALGVALPTVARKNTKGETVTTESLDKGSVAGLLSDDSLDATVREILERRVEANKLTSLAKLKRVPGMLNSDGRVRGMFRFAKAHTGRWASSGVQLHNLPKNQLDDAREARVRDCIMRRDLPALLLTEDRPLDTMSQLLRSMVVAPAGREFIGADFSAIEARGVAWLAGATGVLETFHRGEDVYVKAAADIGSDNRHLGKVCVLALGYGMGVLKFIDTAAKAPVPIHLSRKEARRIVRAWREANPEIVQFWAELEGACHQAVEEPGTVLHVGFLTVRADENCLRVVLPSGRSIRYWQPRVVTTAKSMTTVDEDGELVDVEFESRELRFTNYGSGRPMPDSTYGGKLVENATQAVARDLLGNSLRQLRANGFDVVLHVHDSIVAEVDTGARSVDEFCYRMTELPAWAAGFPLAAEGYRNTRFKG